MIMEKWLRLYSEDALKKCGVDKPHRAFLVRSPDHAETLRRAGFPVDSCILCGAPCAPEFYTTELPPDVDP